MPRIPLAATIAAAATILFLPSIARSAPNCAPWDVLKNMLSEKHHEVEFGGGIVSEKAVGVLFMSPESGTWTIAALGVDGNACIVMSGSGWFHRPMPNADETPS